RSRIQGGHGVQVSPFTGRRKRVRMPKQLLRLMFVVLAAMVPGTLLAQQSGQSAIAGVVKDSTGGVLPGVTVEASSPALIEKSRTAVTNESGQYRVVDLRPGVYTVTFTLAGF